MDFEQILSIEKRDEEIFLFLKFKNLDLSESKYLKPHQIEPTHLFTLLNNFSSKCRDSF